MALPQIPGDSGSLLGGSDPSGGPSPSTASSSDPGDGGAGVQDQVRGAMQQLGSLKQSTETTLKAIATQFPGVAKDAQGLQSAFDSALSNLMRSLVKVTQVPAPQGPKILR